MNTQGSRKTIYTVTVEFESGVVRLITKTECALEVKKAVRRIKNSSMLQSGTVVVDSITMITEEVA